MTNPEHDYAAEERMRGAAREMYEAIKEIEIQAIFALNDTAVFAESTLLAIQRIASKARKNAEGRS